MTTDKLKQTIGKLPSGPGIYLFNNKSKPLYIGKALNLKKRLKSYVKTDNPRLQKMIEESTAVKFIETDSEIEALILESQYIKKYRPDFNIIQRDDKQYSYVGFSNDTYPRIFITHQPKNNFKFKILNSKLNSASAEFVGPFTDAGALKTTLRLLRRIFPYCTCTQLHNNYCLNYHIDKCPGFCCLKNYELRITNPKSPVGDLGSPLRDFELKEKEYKKSIKAIKDILSGKKSSLIKKLEKEMTILSDKHEYEKALGLQSKIARLKKVFENAQIIGNWKMKIGNSDADNKSSEPLITLKNLLNLKDVPHRIEAYDIANIQGKHAVGSMVVFTDGIPNKKQYRKFKIYTKDSPDDTAMLKEILTRRFNHPEWPYPDLILIDGGKGQLHTAETVILNSKLKILNLIPVIALTKNEKHMGHKIIKENGEEISLSSLPVNIRNLLLQIDSEAHRFAIGYYRKLHSRSLR